MAEILKKIEVILIDMWNYLYRFLSHMLDQEPNEDWIVDPHAED